MKDQTQHIYSIKSSLSDLEELLTNDKSFSLSTHLRLREKLNEAKHGLEKLNNQINSSLLTFFDKEISSLKQNISSLELEKNNLMTETQIKNENLINTPINYADTSNVKNNAIKEEVLVNADPVYSEPEPTIEEAQPFSEKTSPKVENKEQSLHEKLSEQSKNNDLNSTLEQKVVFQNLSFDANDRIYFQNELFNGDPYKFHVSLKKMQECESFEFLEKLVNNQLAAEFNWFDKGDIVTKLLTIIKDKTQ